MNWSIETTKDWLRQLLVWHTAQYQEIQRAALARAQGLDPAQYSRPFPGSPQSTTVVVGGEAAPPPSTPAAPPPAPMPPGQPAARPGTPPWLTALLTAGSLLLGASGMGAVSLLQRPAPPPGQPAVAAPAVEPIHLKLAAWRLGADGDWEVQGPDGKWQKVKDLTTGKGK